MKRRRHFGLIFRTSSMSEGYLSLANDIDHGASLPTMSQVPLIPVELTERLDKARGHINAVERHLWDKTDRGIWSGHQAMARAAEIWLWLRGAMTSLPPIERYLPREVLGERLTDLADASPQTPLAPRLQAISTAEAAILAEPFIAISRCVPATGRAFPRMVSAD